MYTQRFAIETTYYDTYTRCTFTNQLDKKLHKNSNDDSFAIQVSLISV